MSVEDFTSAGWIEADPNSKISRAPNTITLSALGADASNYQGIYKDYGANYFSGNITHYIDFQIDEVDVYLSFSIWALTNISEHQYANSSTDPCIFVYLYGAELYLQNDSATYDGTSGLSNNTHYWLKMGRADATNWYCSIYSSEANRTADNPIDTLGPIAEASSYRYFTTVAPEKASGSTTWTGTVNNLDLMPGVAGVYVPHKKLSKSTYLRM